MRVVLLKGQVFGLLLVVLLMGGCRTIVVTANDDICKKIGRGSSGGSQPIREKPVGIGINDRVLETGERSEEKL